MTDADRAIEEVRRSRCAMSQRCGHDMARFVEYLRTFDRRYAEQVQRYNDLYRAAPAESGTAR
ncbi:MAG: hypothetical protein FJ291_26870 [Planctomycetes bacterium]|nr:hypothetical protein [Planctomycetota bacterium]